MRDHLGLVRYANVPPVIQGDVSALLVALATALPICDARCVFVDVVPPGPIVIMRSWVRVRPVLKKVPDVLAETFTSFHVGVTLPLDTITNLIS